jgi:hypothetical protein
MLKFEVMGCDFLKNFGSNSDQILIVGKEIMPPGIRSKNLTALAQKSRRITSNHRFS